MRALRGVGGVGPVLLGVMYVWRRCRRKIYRIRTCEGIIRRSGEGPVENRGRRYRFELAFWREILHGARTHQRKGLQGLSADLKGRSYSSAMVRSRGRAVLRRRVFGGACLRLLGENLCMGRIKKNPREILWQDADAARGRADLIDVDCMQISLVKMRNIWSVATFT